MDAVLRDIVDTFEAALGPFADAQVMRLAHALPETLERPRELRVLMQGHRRSGVRSRAALVTVVADRLVIAVPDGPGDQWSLADCAMRSHKPRIGGLRVTITAPGQTVVLQDAMPVDEVPRLAAAVAGEGGVEAGSGRAPEVGGDEAGSGRSPEVGGGGDTPRDRDTPRDGDTPRDRDTPRDGDTPRDRDTPRDGDTPRDRDISRDRDTPGDRDTRPFSSHPPVARLGAAAILYDDRIGFADGPTRALGPEVRARALELPSRTSTTLRSVSRLMQGARGRPRQVLIDGPDWTELVSAPETEPELADAFADAVNRWAAS